MGIVFGVRLTIMAITNRSIIPNSDKKPTGSIAHATNVLICLSNDINTITDIARECNLGKSSVHRVLKLLAEQYLVVRDNINRRYYLGPLINKLASNPATAHEYLVICANEEMKQLSDISEETVALDIMIGIQYYSLHEIRSRHDLKVTQESRRMRPLDAGASVKVLLSQLSDEKLKVVMDNLDITQVTQRTITNKELLLAQLKEIRQQGYSISYGEQIFGALCISAPIKNYVLPVALSVVGLENRLQSRVKEVTQELVASAGCITDRISSIY